MFRILMLFYGLLLANSLTYAQSSCENPFEGESVRFSTEYWTLTDFCQHSIPYSEIRSGGPAPDGIPPIDDPNFEDIASASAWLQPQSPVIALEIEGDARAYPLAILIWHEIVNDVVGNAPVAVTFCPLCNSSIVFDRRVDGETLRFGVSGLLRNSDMVMWDDKTESWWQQLTGEGIVGVYTGKELLIIPSLVVSFSAFAEQYPEGQVLSRDTGVSRRYGDNPYVGYDDNATPFLFEGDIDTRLPATERVLAGVIAGEPVAYPFSVLAEQRVVNDVIGEQNVVIFWQPGTTSALDQQSIDESQDVGMAAMYDREVNGQVLTFSIGDDHQIRDDQTNSLWNVFGTALEGELSGTQLLSYPAAPHFWFAWAAFRPETRLYEG